MVLIRPTAKAFSTANCVLKKASEWVARAKAGMTKESFMLQDKNKAGLLVVK